MADIEKRLNISALKKGVTWDTEITLNSAGAGILPLNAGVPIQKIPAIEEESAVSAFESDLDWGDFSAVDFGLDFDWRFGGIENILVAMVMGTAGAPVIQGATTAYLHTLQMANNISGLFATYATEKLAKIHVVPSLKPYKLTFSLSGGLIKLSVACRGSRVIDDSAIITTLAAVTYPDKHNRNLWRYGVYHMNAQTGADFADGDKIKPKDVTIEIERKIDTAFGAESRSCVEPRETDKPTVKITMNFNRMDTANAAYFADWKAGTEKKMKITNTSTALAGVGYYYKTLFQFPRLIVEDVEYPDANIIPAKIILRAVEADTNPTGMTGITKPVQLDIINKRTTDFLA